MIFFSRPPAHTDARRPLRPLPRTRPSSYPRARNSHLEILSGPSPHTHACISSSLAPLSFSSLQSFLFVPLDFYRPPPSPATPPMAVVSGPPTARHPSPFKRPSKQSSRVAGSSAHPVVVSIAPPSPPRSPFSLPKRFRTMAIKTPQSSAHGSSRICLRVPTFPPLDDRAPCPVAAPRQLHRVRPPPNAPPHLPHVRHALSPPTLSKATSFMSRMFSCPLRPPLCPPPLARKTRRHRPRLWRNACRPLCPCRPVPRRTRARHVVVHAALDATRV